MSKKASMTIALLVAMTVFVVAPAVALAVPSWYSNGKLIHAGEVVPVETSGALTFHVEKKAVKCKLKDFETIENDPNLTGLDLISRFSLTGCTSKVPLCPTGAQAEVIAEGLPWKSRLLPGPPIRDEIAGMVFRVVCGGTVIDVYHGTLFPEVGKSVLKFGAGSGVLANSKGNPVKVTGSDKLKGPPGDEKITAA
jgi:hypothetical protein